VIYNPRSHRNKGQDLALGDRERVMLATPEKRGQISSVLEDFAKNGIDYLIISGGDGTVRDVLTCGAEVFGDDWPVLAVLPKGKTNALNVDIGAPANWSLAEAIDAFETGSRVTRRPLDAGRARWAGRAFDGPVRQSRRRHDKRLGRGAGDVRGERQSLAAWSRDDGPAIPRRREIGAFGPWRSLAADDPDGIDPAPHAAGSEDVRHEAQRA
jgi:hypothetical protein